MLESFTYLATQTDVAHSPQTALAAVVCAIMLNLFQ